MNEELSPSLNGISEKLANLYTLNDNIHTTNILLGIISISLIALVVLKIFEFVEQKKK